ncbi:tape measure protein [Liquorilactobacillus sp.]|uniref:tape measure protein n=1 Tax=Liquorilactobacillus sp. TaxID=2767923 RepID=UPI0039EC1835
MASDGQINIDFSIPMDQIQSDADKVKDLFSSLGDKIKDNFKDTIKQRVEGDTSDLKSKLENAKELLGSLPKDVKTRLVVEAKKEGIDDFESFLGKLPKEEQIKLIAKAEKGEAIDFKKYIEEIPKIAKTELIANAKAAGIDNFKDLLEKLPKKWQTELIAKAEKGEVINYEELLRKVPSKLVTEAKLNDNASVGLKNLQEEAENTRSRFSRLKDIIVGSFVGQVVYSGVAALQSGLKDLTTSAIEYNKAQQVSLASWTTLTNSASKGQAMVDMANNLSTKFGQARDITDELDQQFYHVLDDAGKTQTLTTSFLTLADTIGLSSDQVKTLGMDFTHTMSSGKMQLGDFNQVADYLPMFGENLLKYEQKVQKNSKLTMSQLQAEMSAGKISATDAMNVINQLGDKYKASADNMMNTLPGIERAIKAKAPALVSALINPFLTAENPLAKSVYKWVNDPATEKSLSGLGKSLSTSLTALTGIVMDVFGGIKNVLASFGASFKANVTGVITSSGVGSTLESLRKAFDKIAAAVKPVEMAVGGLFGVIAGGIVRTSVTIIEGLAKGFEGVGNGADKAKSKMNFDGAFKVIVNISQAFNVWYDALNKVYRPLAEIVGAIVKGVFETFADVISGIAGAFSKMVSSSDKAAGPISILANGLAAIAKHQTALKIIGSAIAAIATATLAVKGVIGTVTAFSKAFDAVEKSIAAVRGAMALLMANPLLLIVSAVVAVGIGFYEAYKHIKPFRDAVNGVAKAVTGGLKTAFDWVKKNWVGIGLLLLNPIDGALKLLYDNNKGFKKWVDDLWKTVSGGFKAGINAVLKTFSSWGKDISKAWDSAVSGISKTMSSWGKSISKTWNSIWSGLTKATESVWNGLKKAAQIAFKGIEIVALAPIVLLAATLVAIWKLIEKPAQAAWKLMQSYIVNPVVSAYKTVVKWFNALAKDVQNVFNIIAKVTLSIWNAISSAIANAAKSIYNVAKSIFVALSNTLRDIFQTIYKVTMSIWNPIKNFVLNVSEAIWRGVKEFFTDLWHDIQNIWNAISKITSSVWNSIKDFLVKLAKMIWDGIKDTFNSLKDDVENIWNGIKNITSSVWNATGGWVINKAKDIWHGIKDNFNHLKDDLSSILDSISSKWQDMWNGVKSFFGDIWSGIKSLAKDGINGVVDFINGGIGGIDKVIHFFGGKKEAISTIPRLATGSAPLRHATAAIVNDQQGNVFREAIIRNNGAVEIPHGRNVMTHLNAGDSVMPAEVTEAVFGGIPQFAGGVGDWFSKMWSGAKGLAGDAIDGAEDLFDALEDTIKHPIKALERVFSNVTNGAKGVFGDMASAGGSWFVKQAESWFTKTLKGLDDAGGGSNPGGSGVQRWKPYVEKALKALGLSTSESMINKVLRQINTESGGNPNAVGGNDGLADGNAMGLMQVKPGTFKAYAKSGMKWNNGYDSIYAGLNYAKSRYGSDLSALGNGHGYDNGGHPMDKQLAWLAESNDEYVVNAQKDSFDSLMLDAINDRAKVAPNSISAKLAGVISSVNSSNGTQIQPSVNYNTSGQQSRRSSAINDKKISGDLKINFVLDGGTIASSTYPKIKAMQMQELTVSGIGAAIPVGGGH